MIVPLVIRIAASLVVIAAAIALPVAAVVYALESQLGQAIVAQFIGMML